MVHCRRFKLRALLDMRFEIGEVPALLVVMDHGASDDALDRGVGRHKRDRAFVR